MSSVPPQQSGFTLVETLVALVVTALLLAIIMNGALGAKERASKAELKRSGVQLAQSLYAERKIARLATTADEGSVGPLRWQANETVIAKDPRGFFVLSEIDIAISDLEGHKLYQLRGRKLKPVGPS